MQNKIIKLKKIIEQSNSIVFFGGAGISTEIDTRTWSFMNKLIHRYL